MTIWDWIIVWVPLIFVLGVAAYTQRFNKSVADFIAAGRCAGRYLLTTARGTAGSAVYTIALFQITGKTGFTFGDRKSTRLNSSHLARSRMPSSA